MKKKVISLVLAIIIVISSLAVSFSAFASSQELYLNVKTAAIMNGKNDLEWFFYTPDQSGWYSFLSYSVPLCEAYLFVKEIDPETGAKKYVQLAYATEDPDYEKNDHNYLQFCLTYHLEAGTTYYYAAGWCLQSTTVKNLTVMLRCDSYDEHAIDSIEILDMPVLDAYTGGEWRTDADSKDYYHYDMSKIIRNSTIKVNFSNGTSQTVTGKSEVNGYQINFIENQYQDHWYPDSDICYTGNLVTIKILDKTASYHIKLNNKGLYYVAGKIVDFNGAPVENAQVTIGHISATTDSDGFYWMSSLPGNYNIEIKTDKSIDYKSTITVIPGNNDSSDTPLAICNCNYVKDDYINAKDYAYILNNLSSTELEAAKAEFSKAINFSSADYNKIS